MKVISSSRLALAFRLMTNMREGKTLRGHSEQGVETGLRQTAALIDHAIRQLGESFRMGASHSPGLRSALPAFSTLSSIQAFLRAVRFVRHSFPS